MTYSQSTHTRPNASPKSRLVTLLLCLFLGYLGVHRFYVGKTGTGILYLCTYGAFGIGVLVDLVMILSGSFSDSHGLPITEWEENAGQSQTTTTRTSYQPTSQQAYGQPYGQPTQPRTPAPPPGPVARTPTSRPPDAYGKLKKDHKICVTCGSVNELDATFCASCGANMGQ